MDAMNLRNVRDMKTGVRDYRYVYRKATRFVLTFSVFTFLYEKVFHRFMVRFNVLFERDTH